MILLAFAAQLFIRFYAAVYMGRTWLKYGYLLASVVFLFGLLSTINHFPLGRESLAMGSLLGLLLFGYNFINTKNGGKKDIGHYLILSWLVITAFNFNTLDMHYNGKPYLIAFGALLLCINILYILYSKFF